MTLDAQTIIYLVLIGITAGVVSGFIGIGGGIIIVPGLDLSGRAYHKYKHKAQA